MGRNLIPVDRSRSVTDWTCGRKRYLNYELDGFGIVPEDEPKELAMGSILHTSLAAIAEGQLAGDIDIDSIASTAKQGVLKHFLDPHSASVMPSRSDKEELYAKEQSTLVEGLIRGFYKYQWPQLMAMYPKILAIEQEMPYTYETLLYMSKPDLVAATPEGQVAYIEYKSTSSKKPEWINSWNSAIQLHSTTRAIESHLGERIDHVVVQGLYKGYEAYGKQSSPFCLVPETKVLTANLEWVTLGSIKEGDELVGFDEYPVDGDAKNPTRYWKGSNTNKIGRAFLPCSKVTLSNGSSVTCSNEHKWLTGQSGNGLGASTTRWTSTKHLRSSTKFGLRASRIVKLIEPWQEGTSKDIGYLEGAYDGEGYLTHVNSTRDVPYLAMGFSQKPGKVMDRVSKLLKEIGVKYHGPYGPVDDRSAGSLLINKRVDVMRALGIIRPQRLLDKFKVDHLGILRTEFEPLVVVSVEDVGVKEVVTIETSTKTFVAEGLASHNCYSYARKGTPPFSTDQISYEYKAGFQKSPVWEMAAGVKGWVAGMPDDVLVTQFPITPPIIVNEDLVEAFFAQRNIREQEIQLALSMLEDCDEEARQFILNTSFTQRFDQCSPAYGKGCAYKQICFGPPSANPLEHGFTYRKSHHAIEQAAQDAAREVKES